VASTMKTVSSSAEKWTSVSPCVKATNWHDDYNVFKAGVKDLEAGAYTRSHFSSTRPLLSTVSPKRPHECVLEVAQVELSRKRA